MSIYEMNNSVVLVSEDGNILEIKEDDSCEKITFKLVGDSDKRKPCFASPTEKVAAIDMGFGTIYDEVKANHVKTNEYYTYATFIMNDSKLLMLGDESTVLSIMRNENNIAFYLYDSKKYINKENTFAVYRARDNFLFDMLANMINDIKEEKKHVKQLKM